jgi:hypothetical protein
MSASGDERIVSPLRGCATASSRSPAGRTCFGVSTHLRANSSSAPLRARRSCVGTDRIRRRVDRPRAPAAGRDTGRHEPRQPDAITDAELERALSDPAARAQHCPLEISRRSPPRSASSAATESRFPSHPASSQSATTTSPPGLNTPPAATFPPSPSRNYWPAACATRFARCDTGAEPHDGSLLHQRVIAAERTWPIVCRRLMSNILLISGSLRAGSTNTATIRTAQQVAPDGVTTTIYDGMGSLPQFNPDDDRDAVTRRWRTFARGSRPPARWSSSRLSTPGRFPLIEEPARVDRRCDRNDAKGPIDTFIPVLMFSVLFGRRRLARRSVGWSRDSAERHIAGSQRGLPSAPRLSRQNCAD